MRYLLYLLWSMISLVVIILVGVTLLLTVYNDELETRLLSKIEKTTGRNIEIQGGFGFSFNPRPTFYIHDIKMENTPWGSQPWMLEIDSMQASLSFSGLLQGEFNVYSIEASRPQILVEQDPVSKDINWVFETKNEPKIFKRLADHLRINSARIEDAQIRIEVGPIDHFIQLDQISGQTDFFSKMIAIQATGRMHERELLLNIEAENLRSMLLREPTWLSFDGRYGEADLNAQGSVRDLLRWRGHDIKLGLSTHSLDYLQPWISTRLIETPKLEGSARFVQKQKWASAKFENILVTSQALDGASRITGRVGQLKGLKGIDLKGDLHYPLASILRWKGLESKSDALIKAEVSLFGNKNDKLGFEIDSATLKGTGIDANGAGKIDHLLQDNTGGIPFKLSADSLNRIGEITAKQWFKTGPLTSTFNIKKKDGKLALGRVRASAFNGRALVEGELDDITKTQLGVFELNTTLNEDDIERINTLNNKVFPLFKRNQIKSTIHMAKAEFSSPETYLNLSDTGLRLRISGPIDNLNVLELDRAKISLNADKVGRINKMFNITLPELGRVNAAGEISGDINNPYNINIIEGLLNNKYQSFLATGSAYSLGPDMTAEFDVQITARGVENLPKLFDSELKPPETLRARGHAKIIAESLSDWSFTNIDLNLVGENEGTLKGAIRHIPEAEEYALAIDLKKVNASALPKMDMMGDIQQENLSAYLELDKITGQESFSLNNIDAQFTVGAGRGTIRVAGDIQNIHDFTGIDLTLGLHTSDLKSMPYLVNLPFKPGINGVGTLKISGVNEKLKLALSGFRLNDTDVGGQLTLDRKGRDRPKISGKLHSNKLDILSLLQQEKRKRLFSDTALEFDWLNDFNAAITITAKRFNGVIAHWEDAVINISIDNGLLSIPNANGRVGDGNIALWLSVVGSNKPYNMISTIKAENIRSDKVNLFGTSGFIRGGTIDIDIGLGGVGDSIANYMDNVYGKIQFQLRDSSLKNANLELFGADLVTGVLEVINPFKKQEAYLPIECGVIHFPVIKGNAVASQGIAIKTHKVTVLGGGAIDLGDEELQLLIKPKARKGLGFSAGTIANIAKISGDFAKPKITLDSGSVLQTTAAIGAAIASGGWTLLAQGLLDRNKANSDVCAETLEEPNKENIIRKTLNVFDVTDDR